MFAYLTRSSGSEGGFAIATERFLCLLGPSSTARQAREVYEAIAADSAQLDDALEAVTTGFELSDFAIVQVLDPRARRLLLAVQGGVVADIEGAMTTRLSGPAGAAWMTGEGSGVRALSLSLEGEAGGSAPLPLRNGVVPASAVALEPSAAAPPAAAPSTPLEATPSRTTPVDASGPDSTAQRLYVRLPDGNPLAASTRIVFGRRPRSAASDARSVVGVAVDSPRREISGVHLEISEAGDGLRARDLDSTNGTIVSTPGRPPWLLEQGRETALTAGDVLDLGEGYRVTIARV